MGSNLPVRTACTLFLLAITIRPTAAGVCKEVLPDEEVRCPYHPIDPVRHNVVFVDAATDAIRAMHAGNPLAGQSEVIFDPFLQDLGWAALATTVSPDRERALIMRFKPSCPPYQGVLGRGLDCTYGRVTLWLAYHDGDQWVHLNLARRGLGRNSEAHGWATWLHGDLALFNVLVRPDHAPWVNRQEENTAQAYAIRFRSHSDFSIEPYAPEELFRDDTLTGRINAQPSPFPDRCFDGQRVSIVRRRYSEPDSDNAWAWWNTRRADGSGGRCRNDQAPLRVPVLRTYVMELNAECRPKLPIEQMLPAHEPEFGPVYRKMGSVAEWGDMLSAISADGRFLAMATNMADPAAPSDDNCGGFKLRLSDPDDPFSGQSNRNAHLCELDSTLRCVLPPVRMQTLRSPPESTQLPGFVSLVGDEGPFQLLLLNRQWGVWGGSYGTDFVGIDLRANGGQQIAMQVGVPAMAAVPIVTSPQLQPR